MVVGHLLYEVFFPIFPLPTWYHIYSYYNIIDYVFLVNYVIIL